MFFPLAIAGATVLSPIIATALLSFGLVARASLVHQSKTPLRAANGSKPVHGLNELSRLHDELKLDTRQETLWHKAEKGDWSDKGEECECLRKRYEAVLGMLSETATDFQPGDSRIDTLDAPEARHGRWMAVYETLGPEQKKLASQFYKAKLEQLECFRPGNKARI